MSEKKCTQCGEVKPFSEYYKKLNSLTPRCKCCHKTANNECYKKNRQARIEYAKSYRENNKDELLEKSKKQYLKNQSKNKEKARRHYHKNRDKIIAQKKQYREQNKEAISAKQYIYKKNKLKHDHNYKTIENIRRRMLLAVKGNNKSASTLELLGCTPEQVRQHLEEQFTGGMNWDNHGLHGWHIDHIVPCSSFDMANPEHQRKCFHYTNLQPLWAEDNLRKSDKINQNQTENRI